jgi:F0F1-type ATP synthase membrane subunit c/vacuolar-type H+-ATPase subunit K
MEAILRNPEMKGKIMTYMILFLALVESSAIYGLVVALSLLG